MRAWFGRIFGVPLLVFSLLLSACTQGIREFGVYTDAFNAQYQQGDEVLNLLAKAERELFNRRDRRSVRIARFNPTNAAYYVDTVDPPVTASIRGSIKSLKLYNDALGALANGEAAEALTNRVGALASNIVGTVAAVQVAAGGPAAALGAEALVGNAGEFLKDAAPFFKQAVTWASREAFREQLVQGYPSMRKLLLTLRDGTSTMYLVFERYRSDRADTPTGLSDAALGNLKKDREMLAGWVLLLDKTLETMDTAVVAVMSNTPDVVLAGLSDSSTELRVLAEKVKSLRAR